MAYLGIKQPAYRQVHIQALKSTQNKEQNGGGGAGDQTWLEPAAWSKQTMGHHGLAAQLQGVYQHGPRQVRLVYAARQV